jgi:hypothetical protein
MTHWQISADIQNLLPCILPVIWNFFEVGLDTIKVIQEWLELVSLCQTEPKLA